MEAFFAELDSIAKAKWDEIHRKPFWHFVKKQGIDIRLYYILMREIYHYTRHNTQNQALAAIHVFSDQLNLLKFALHHAYAEAGHDQMVINDLKNLELDYKAVEESEPLPETQAFIAYLYRVAQEEGPIARLGYSYWAESCYEHISDLTDAMKNNLRLKEDQMTFFIEHSAIDEAHFKQVKKAISDSVRGTYDMISVKSALATSLHLQGLVLDGVFNDYLAENSRDKDDAA